MQVVVGSEKHLIGRHNTHSQIRSSHGHPRADPGISLCNRWQTSLPTILGTPVIAVGRKSHGIPTYLNETVNLMKGGWNNE